MRSLNSRSVSARWDVPPDAVAAAIRRAIADERYEDAGHPTGSLWLVPQVEAVLERVGTP